MFKVAIREWTWHNRNQAKSPTRRLVQGICLAGLLGLLGVGMLFKVYPSALVWTVDHTRAIVGPAAIARLETEVFRLRSLVRQARVGLGDTAPRWDVVADAESQQPPLPTLPVGSVAETAIPATIAPTWTATVSTMTAATAAPSPTEQGTATPGSVASAEPTVDQAPSATVTPQPTATPSLTATPLFTPKPAATTRPDWPPKVLAPVIADGKLAQEGEWRPLHSLGDGGETLMMVTTFRPDAARPYIQAAIVAIDLTRTRLRLVAGTEEPPAPEPDGHTRQVRIPDDVQEAGTLLAAFNGAFKYEHGQDGIGVNGVTYIEPIWGRATLCIHPGGSVRIAAYGEHVASLEGLEGWRQNARLLMWEGAVTDLAREGGLRWGVTVDWQAETWRSGVGLSADGQTLYYVVGDGLTSLWLAEVFHTLGCDAAMQLDINDYWVRFVTFEQDEAGMLRNQPLISAMPKEPQKYLATDKRDFFYLVRR